MRFGLISAARSAVFAAAATESSTTTAATLFARLGDVHRQRATVQGFAIERVNRGLRLFRRAHGDETEATWASGLAIRHEIRFNHGTASGKSVLKTGLGSVEGKVSNEQFAITHLCDVLQTNPWLQAVPDRRVSNHH